MKLGVFIERDGVLNQVRVDHRHQITPMTLAEFKINPDAIPLVAKLRAAGLIVIATTNQPGLSDGRLSRRELDRMHDLLRRSMALNDIFVCPHSETDQCPCRKPKAGLLIEAKFKWQLDLDRSFVISDKWQDAETARAAGCTSVMLKSPWVGSAHHDVLMPDLTSAVEKILQIQVPGAEIAA